MTKKWGHYPVPQAQRVGCKVSWNYYVEESDAKKASVIARANAEIALSEGYDFGYCSPGSIRQCKPDEKWNIGYGPSAKPLIVSGMFEVCLP